MASCLQLLLFSSLLLVSLSYAQKPFKPNALILQVQRDTATHLYTTTIQKRTPQVPIKFVVDLTNRFLWVSCHPKYFSSTYHAPRCKTHLCAMASENTCRGCFGPASPGCHNDTCNVVSDNPLTRRRGPGELAVDVLSIQSTDGSKPGPFVTVPEFLFGCAPNFTLDRGRLPYGQLPSGVEGFVGFAVEYPRMSFPTQLASHFGLQPKFGLCLGSKGVIFIGNEPYILQPGVDVSKSLTYTPLIIGPKKEYNIHVQAIQINDKNVPINTSLLYRSSENGIHATQISAVVPYTILESSIFKAVLDFYAKELSSVARVSAVSPFSLCFNASQISYSRIGPSVPSIDLVLQNNNVHWRIFGANVVTRVGDAVCLAFVDGGIHNNNAIIIGTHQMEDNFLLFDPRSNQLGFSGSLLFKRTTCANFNFA